MKFNKKVRFFVCAVMALLLTVLSCESVSAADLKEQERQELIRAGFKEVTVQEAEQIGVDYYNNRNRYSEPVKVFCEGTLSSSLEELYTTYVNCYDSYEECAMAAFIKYKKRSYYITYSFDVEYGEVRQGLMTDTQYEMAKDKAKQLSYEFNYGTTFDKIERAYRWICDNMEYDDTLSRGSAYDALILGDTVCTGYASAFQLIMEQMGIESYLVQGSVDGEGHEWNAVKLDDKYYFVDATFGDTSGQLNKYLLFGTDRRENETYLDITSKSKYFSYDDIDNITDEEALEVLIGLGIITTVFILLIILVIALCLNHDKKKKRKMMQQNGYGYYNPYGGPAPGMMGGQYNNNPYRQPGVSYGNPYGQPGTPYNNPYGQSGTPYNNPYGQSGTPYGNPNFVNSNLNSNLGNPYMNNSYGVPPQPPTQGGAVNPYGGSRYGDGYNGMGTVNRQNNSMEGNANGQSIWNPYGSNKNSSSDNDTNTLSYSNTEVKKQEESNPTAQDSDNDINNKD